MTGGPGTLLEELAEWSAVAIGAVARVAIGMINARALVQATVILTVVDVFSAISTSETDIAGARVVPIACIREKSEP